MALDKIFQRKIPEEQGISIIPPPPISPPDISVIDRKPLPSIFKRKKKDDPELIRAGQNVNIAKTLNLNPQTESDLVKKSKESGQPISFLRAAGNTISTSPDITADIPAGVLHHLSKSPTHAAVSGRDIAALSNVEKTAKLAKERTEEEISWWDRFSNNLKIGTDQVIDSSLGSIRAFSAFFSETDKLALAVMPESTRKAEIARRKGVNGDRGIFPLFPEIGKAFTVDPDELEKISEKTRELQEKEFFEVLELTKREGLRGWYDDVVIMAPQIVAQVFAQAVGGPITSSSLMASQISGGQFTQLTAEGVDDVTSAKASFVNALIQTPLETISLQRAMRLWKPGRTGIKVLKEVLGSMGTEFVTEWIQQYPEAVADIWARAQENNISLSEQVDIFIKNFWDITKAGIYSGSIGMIYGGFTSFISIGAQVHRDSTWIDREQKINDAINETETKRLSPEITKEFLDIVGVGEDVFLSAEGAKQLFQQDQGQAEDIFERLGVEAQQARESSAAGVDIIFSESSLHSALSPEEFGLIKDHLKAAPGASTAFERSTGVALEEINRLDAIFQETRVNQEAFDKESDRIKQQVVDAGHTQEFADTYIDTVQRFANRIALEGRDRVDFLEGINIQVKSRAESEKGRVFEFEQVIKDKGIPVDIRSKGFIDWFGSSKVTDSSGLPVTVFHGTNADIEGGFFFDVDFVGSNLGFDQEGFFFTSNKEAALLYGDNVLDVFLKIENPDVYDLVNEGTKADQFGEERVFHSPSSFFDFNQKEILKEADNSNADGVIIKKDDDIQYVVFDNDQIISIFEDTQFGEDGFSFEQAEKKVPPRGRVRIDSDGYLVSLFQTRNLSTLLHETGHIFFEELMMMVDTGQASEGLAKDMNVIRDWLGLEEGEMFKDEHHEQFARGFEAYLLEGKAPTIELATAFARFKRWLSQVYKSVKELNVTLNADIRKVFDRLLAGEVEIENSAELNGLVIDQQKMDALGVVPEDQAFMKRLIKTAQDKAKDGLTKDRNRGYRANIKKFRVEATEEIDFRKEYRDVADIVATGGMSREEYTFDYLVEGEVVSESVPAGELQVGDVFEINGEKHTVIREDEVNGNLIIKNSVELSFDPFDLVEIDGGLSGIGVEAIEASRLPDRRLLKLGGRSIGSVAIVHGYENANQMIDTFHNMLPRTLAIQQLVNDKLAEFDAQFQAEDYLMGTKEFAEYLTILSKYLEGSPVREAGKDIPTGKKSTKTLSRQRFKAFAVDTINAMTVREARRTDRFLSAMKKAANEERKATLAGDFGKAAQANERVRLNYELAGESVRIRAETDKLLRRSGKVVNAKIDNEYKQQVFKLLRRFALTDRKFRIDPDAPATEVFFLKLQKMSDIDLFRSVPIFDPFLMADGMVTDYRDLSVAELRRVDEVMGYLVKNGRDVINKTLSDGKTLIEDKVIELSHWILEHRIKDKKSIREDKKLRRAASDFTRNFFARSDELIFIMRKLDGFVSVKGQVGPNETFWNDQLNESEASDQLRTKSVIDEIKPPLEQFGKSSKKFPNKIDIKGVPVPDNMRKHGRIWNFHKIVSVALNMGNNVNRKRVLTGYGYDFKNINGDDDVGKQRAQLDKITSILTAQDWRAVQEIWNTVNKMWPDQARAFFRLNGFHRPKVEADLFVVTAINEDTGKPETITLEGGYYPLDYDPELSEKPAEWTERADIINDTDSLFPVTSAKSGQMIERVESTNLPVKLSLSVLYKHISQASRYISYAELLSDISQVMKHPTYKETVTNKEGRDVYQRLRPILAHIARPHDNMLDFVDNWIEREIGRSTVNILGSSLSVPIKQAFSLPLFLNEVGNQNFTKGAAIWINGVLGRRGVIWSPFETWRAIKEMEPFMSQRSKTFDRDMRIVFKKVDIDPKLLARGFTADDLGAAFMSAIRAVDFITVGPAWWAEYQNGLIDNNGDADKARKQATRAIRFTQPSGLPIDKNHFQSSKKGWHRLATMFSSFAFKAGQHQRYNWNAWNNRDANGKRTLSSTKYFNHIIFDQIVPPLLMSMLFSVLRDEEIEPEELLIDVASYQFMGLFMIREMMSTVAWGLKRSSIIQRDAISSPAFQGVNLAANMFLNISKLIGDLSDEDKQEQALLSFATMIGYAYKVPVDRVAKTVVKGWEQYEREGGIPTKILFPSHKR